MKITTEAEYQEARQLLADLDRRIETAPVHSVPVFKGIVELHDAVRRWEARRN